VKLEGNNTVRACCRASSRSVGGRRQGAQGSGGEVKGPSRALGSACVATRSHPNVCNRIATVRNASCVSGRRHLGLESRPRGRWGGKP
jgi:hypothetical protein